MAQAQAAAAPTNPKKEVVTFSPVGLLCFANGLFTPRPQNNNADAKERYSVTVVFDQRGVKTQAWQELRRIVANAISEKWGAAKAADPNFKRSLRLPFRTDKKPYEGFEDAECWINPWAGVDSPPEVMDAYGNTLTDPKTVFSGMMGRVKVKAFGYDNSGNKGVGLILLAAQIVKSDMPRLDGKSAPGEAFKDADNSELIALGIDPSGLGDVSSGVTDTSDLDF